MGVIVLKVEGREVIAQGLSCWNQRLRWSVSYPHQPSHGVILYVYHSVTKRKWISAWCEWWQIREHCSL